MTPHSMAWTARHGLCSRLRNVDFTVTTKFDSIPSQQYQFEGMVVDQNASNFLRLQFGSSGSVFAISADAIVARSDQWLVLEYDHAARRDNEPLAAIAANGQ